MKKIISLFLTVILVLSLMPSAFAAERVSKFTDVPENAWYREELDYAVYSGFISGTSSDRFSPDGQVTRGQFVTILGRMLGADSSNGKTQYSDVPENAYYAPYVSWASSVGYVNGMSSTIFAPGNNITFEQMGTILANYIKSSGVVLTGTKPIEQYADAETISGWAKENMELMRQHDLLPVDGKNVRPQKAVSRAEAAVCLVRLARATGLGEEPPKESTSDETPSTTEQAMVNAVVQNVHEELWNSGVITKNSTEKEKAIAYFDWMCKNCNYRDGDEGTSVDDAYGALVEGYAECDGLSRGFYELLKSEDILCLCVGDLKIKHMVNEVRLDGEWYSVDMAASVMLSKNADGSYDSFMADIIHDTYFGTPIDGPTYPESIPWLERS